MQNKGYYVVRGHSRSRSDAGTNWNAACDFLLVINSDGHPILYRFEVIADCCLNFGNFAFYSPLGGLG